MYACSSSHGLKRSWRSCPRRVNAGNKNTPSTHHPRRRNVTTLMVIAKSHAVRITERLFYCQKACCSHYGKTVLLPKAMPFALRKDLFYCQKPCRSHYGKTCFIAKSHAIRITERLVLLPKAMPFAHWSFEPRKALPICLWSRPWLATKKVICIHIKCRGLFRQSGML